LIIYERFSRWRREGLIDRLPDRLRLTLIAEGLVGDFCAWTEVFLGGRWYTFDAHCNVPRIGRIAVARVRNASDVPTIASFGVTGLKEFQVRCEVSRTRISAE